MAVTKQSLRVLVVEDNRDGADTLTALLRFSGFATEIARDGLEALELADRMKPDVVVLDIGLPRVNGHDVCRHIRPATWGRYTAVIAVTGRSQEEARKRSIEAGVDLHLVKPVRDTALIDAVKSQARAAPHAA